jgi:hypothetical protein
MPGVPRELAEHALEVNKTKRPIKQKLQRFAKDRKQAIEVEVCKLLAAGFIRECKHPVWLANPVLVPKKTGRLRMCIDYTDLNKHCPKDPFPLPRIDQVVNSSVSDMGTLGSPPTRLTAVPEKWVRPTRRPTDLSVGPTDLVGGLHDLLKTFQKIPQST